MISVWESIYDTEYKENRATITVPELFSIIKSNTYKIVVEKIRAEQDKDKRRALKTMLSAVTPSGMFRERKLHGLIRHSNFICLDFDNLEQKAESIRNALKHDKFVYGYFYSVSGKGLAVFVKIDAHRHGETFDALEKYFYEQYGMVADIGCKDITRLRYMSYDQDAYTNTASEVYNKFPKAEKKPKKYYIDVPSTKTDIGKIVHQAIIKRVDITDGSYSEWQRLAASLATLGDSGREFFHALSQFHPKYDYIQADRKFSNLLSTANGSITIGTFYHFAKRAGLETNTEKSSHIIKTCREVKRIPHMTADTAIKRLTDKKVICTGDPASKEEDIELVKKVYEQTDAGEVIGIQEVENYILENWKVKRNEITNYIEFENGKELEDRDLSEIYIETKKQYPRISKTDVTDIIFSKSEMYNPLKMFVESNRHLIAEGKTYGLIEKLAHTICGDNGLTEDSNDIDYENYFITKWIVGMVASIYGHTSPLLLALVGPQNTGKSFWLRNLLPKELRPYMAQMKLLDDKDASIAMTKYLLILDDELMGKSKMEEKHLKELTSKEVFTFRPPYGRTSIHRKRLAVLCGTTNDTSVLSDPTGNRRIIPIKVLSTRQEEYNSIDKTALFMEAVRLFESGYKWELTNEDVNKLNKNTIEHVAENFERELIELYFKKPTFQSEDFHKTATEILLILEKETNQKLNLRKIGMELRLLGYPRTIKRIDGKASYGYLIIQKEVYCRPG